MAVSISTVHPHGRGERACSLLSAASITVHPHGRGERALSKLIAFENFGSSPRSWGTLKDTLQTAIIIRFIPTVVGNAPEMIFIDSKLTVHPHGRGERMLNPIEPR